MTPDNVATDGDPNRPHFLDRPEPEATKAR